LNVDVLVIGAGPAGGTSSLLLARSGLNVLIVDSKKSIGKRSCSGILGYKCLEELPVNPEPFVVSEIKSGTFESPGGAKIRVEGNIAKVVDRVALDKEIIDEAISYGAKIRTGCRFIGIENGKAITWGKNGLDAISFKYLVGADGVYSKVRDLMGLEIENPYIGVQAFSQEKEVSEEFIVRIKEGSRFSWVYPWGKRNRVGVLGRKTDPVMEWIKEANSSLEEMFVAAIPSKPLRSFHKGNIALVGDAAGQVKPLSRGGVYLGVTGAKLLSRSIIESYEKGSSDIEKRYETEWWRLFGFEVKAGLALRKVLDSMNSKALDSLFASLEAQEMRISPFDIDRQFTSIIKRINKLDLLRVVLHTPKLFLRFLTAFMVSYVSYF